MSPNNSLRILYSPGPPNVFAGCRHFPQFVPTIQCPFPGWTVEIISSMVEGLGRSITPLVITGPTAVSGEKLENGTWTGLFGHLQNGSVDLICTTFQRTKAREDSFDYSYPLTNFQPMFVAKKIRLETASSIRDNFTSFDGYVWACLGGVVLMCMLVFSLIAYVEYKMGLREKEDAYDMTWNTIAAQLLSSPESFHFHTFGGKFALTFFLLLSTGVMMYSYEGFVIFSVLLPDKPFPFTEAEMIRGIADKSLILVTKGNGYWLGPHIKEAKGQFFERLRHALQNNPLVFANSSEVKRLVSTGRAVYLTSEDDGTLLKVKELCDVVTNAMIFVQKRDSVSLVNKFVEASMPQPSHRPLDVQTGSRLTAIFNKEIIRQQSFIHRTQRKYFELGFRLEKATKCTGQLVAHDPFSKPMTMYGFKGILALLLYGLAAAIIVFVLELIVRRVHNHMLLRAQKPKK